jgi:hypothetical protein
MVIGEAVLPRMKEIEDALPDVSAAIEPLLKRIEELEAKPVPHPEVGKDDLAAIVADVASLRKAVDGIPDVDAALEKAALAWQPELSAEDIEGLVIRHVNTAKAILPNETAVQQMVADAMAVIPPAQPGKDADPEEMRREIAEQVKAAVSAIPAPKDGNSVTLDDVRPLIDEAVTKAVAAIPLPKDGADVAGGTIDRDGHLIITLSNGTTKDFGLVVGRDGVDADMDALEQSIVEKVAAIPLPKDGLDGIGFDDMDFEVRDDGCYIVFIKGEIEKEARLPIPIDRGVYKEGQTYRKGDGVTWGGSFWFAQEETTEKPDSGKGWRLAIKKGRDGKDADGKGSTKPVKV